LLKFQARPFLDPQDNESGWRVTQVDFTDVQQRYEEYKRLRAKPLNRLLDNSALLQLGQRALGQLPQTWGKLTRSKEGAFPDKKHLAILGQNYCSQPPEYKRAWDVTGRILTRLNREVRASGARLLVMSVPAMNDVDEDVMTRIIREAPQGVR
jgi:hypothetical protein